MVRPITKGQMATLWRDEYGKRNHCCLCGNHGIINTRNKVFTAAGFECGDIAFCICPNGRSWKDQDPQAIERMKVNPSSQSTGGER
ncbi:hypothetical protein UFOVP122_67 [uncultured Caudovirales phage]|uniref:Uncharacterized protein n=1 Tax=uncultured Caudovirales phage TaxID=2100421 RepID=A0A6J5L9N7_9CAUD|nr:hypothetical protein UFOVP122_67 [uncultured Caudovirales phage]